MATFTPSAPTLNIQSAVASGGLTIDSQPPKPKIASPTVFSAAPAVDHVTNTIVPAMKTASQSINDQQAKLQADKDAAAKAALAVKPVVAPTPTEPIPTPGTKFAYKADGTVVPISLSANAKDLGYLDTKPLPIEQRPVLETAETASGTSLKKFADGTYGMFDVEGKYIGTGSEQQFTNARNGQATLNKLNQAVNGEFPLTPSQQAQIDAVKGIYQTYITQQEKDNANFTGGTTTAQNLYGMGNTGVGQGIIKGVIDAGTAKVTDIQSKMNKDVATMTAAFQSDNIQLLKTAYDSFSKNSSELQNSLDKMRTETAQVVKDEETRKTTMNLNIDNDIRTIIGQGAKGGATPEQLSAAKVALEQHDYEGAVKALGDSTIEFSPAGKEYRDYVANAKASGVSPMGWNAYQTADANRKASIARAGAAIASGTNMTTKQQAVFNHIIDQQNKSPLIMANDRAVILKKITDEVSKDPSNAALQVSFIYSMVQALDTYQSAVREGEISLIAGTQGLGEKLGNVASKVEKGNPLNPSKIAEYVKVSKTLTNSINSAAESKKNTYRAQASINGIAKQYNEWDDVTKSLNEKPVGDEHVATAKEAQDGLRTASQADTKIAAQISTALQKPGATPESVYKAAKARGLIQ